MHTLETILLRVQLLRFIIWDHHVISTPFTHLIDASAVTLGAPKRR
jgi:hypothetical protein